MSKKKVHITVEFDSLEWQAIKKLEWSYKEIREFLKSEAEQQMMSIALDKAIDLAVATGQTSVFLPNRDNVIAKKL